MLGSFLGPYLTARINTNQKPINIASNKGKKPKVEPVEDKNGANADDDVVEVKWVPRLPVTFVEFGRRNHSRRNVSINTNRA